jgi:hypothetical protein
MAEHEEDQSAHPKSGAINEHLFEESGGAVSPISLLFFILLVVCLFGGMIVMSYAFTLEQFMIEVFALGLALATLGFMLPFTILPAIGK